jgi:hypothetical protein
LPPFGGRKIIATAPHFIDLGGPFVDLSGCVAIWLQMKTNVPAVSATPLPAPAFSANARYLFSLGHRASAAHGA